MVNGTNGDKYLNRRVFFSVIAIITCVLGWVITSNASTNSRINTINGDVGEIKGDIKAINENIGWIRKGQENLQESIKDVMNQVAGMKYHEITP